MEVSGLYQGETLNRKPVLKLPTMSNIDSKRIVYIHFIVMFTDSNVE
jgi:hypothetical protein